MRPFLKSILLGALVGAAPYLLTSLLFALFAIPRAFSSVSEFASLLVLAISPLIVAVPIVAAGALMIGLPTTRLLKRWNQENGFTYTAAGGGSGAVMALVLAVLLAVPDLPWAALLGAFSGAVTGFSWWRLARSARVAAPEER